MLLLAHISTPPRYLINVLSPSLPAQIEFKPRNKIN